MELVARALFTSASVEELKEFAIAEAFASFGLGWLLMIEGSLEFFLELVLLPLTEPSLLFLSSDFNCGTESFSS